MSNKILTSEEELSRLSALSQAKNLDFADIDGILRQVPALCATVRHLREMMADPIFGFQELQTRLTRMQEERDALRQEVEGLRYQRMFTDSHVGDD